MRFFNSPDPREANKDWVRPCRAADMTMATNACELPLTALPAVYERGDEHGRIVFANE
jgi:hypothetical protein